MRIQKAILPIHQLQLSMVGKSINFFFLIRKKSINFLGLRECIDKHFPKIENRSGIPNKQHFEEGNFRTRMWITSQLSIGDI